MRGADKTRPARSHLLILRIDTPGMAKKGSDMSEAKRAERPLSPFMIGPYYRPQLTSMVSILTRITGNALVVATALAVWWLAAAAVGPEAFATANWVATSWFGDLVFTGSAWALWYHYLAGLRHLWFDAGYSQDIRSMEKLGLACIIGSVVLTALTIFVVQ